MADQTHASSYDPAVRALNEFTAGKYDDCVKHLTELSSLVKQNKQLTFNKAVADFYLSNFRNDDAFRKELIQITGQLWPSVNATEIKSLADTAIYYSYSVLLYHTRHYAQAYNILEKLFSFKDQIKDGNLCCSIVLLLMEVCLCRRMPDKVTYFGEQAANLFHSKPPEVIDLMKRLKLRSTLMSRRQIRTPLILPSVEWLFLIAHQQYVNGDFQGAAETLGRHRQLPDVLNKKPDADELWGPINNNLGILYSAMNKQNLSVRYMQQALKEHIKSADGDNAAKLTSPRDRPVYVFNLGIALLKANRPEDAFECLVEAARHFPNNPRIWLRLAECCVSNYSKINREDTVLKKIGSGPHTKLLPSNINNDRYTISGESYAIPTLSLEFAALCLMNSVTLLPSIDSPKDTDQLFFQVAPSSPMNFKQYCNLRTSVLLLYSFVSLRLSDPVTALQHCNSLLSRPVGPVQRALAHLYAAESLISLDRISEAIDHLNPTTVHHLTKTNAATQEAIHVAFCMNGAVCYALRGDLNTARDIVIQTDSPRALPLRLYLETCAGKVDNCRMILRKFTQVPYQ